MEPQSIANGFQWLGIALGSIFGAIGLGGIILFGLKRYFGGKDKQATVKETNNANELSSQAGFRDDLLERIIFLEANQKEQHEEIKQLMAALTDQKVENAKLTAENDNVKKDNVRMELEITELRKFRREDAMLIAELRSEVDALKLIIANNNYIVDPLKVRMVDEEGKDR